MSQVTPIVCAGSVLWDIVGKTPHPLDRGSDEPGRITNIPGGVAMNIAMALRKFDLPVCLLTCLGQDHDGDGLIREAEARKMDTRFVYRAPHLSTDRYLAIEDATGMIAAVADAHSLERAGEDLLQPLFDGRLATPEKPWTGMLILDGNFTRDQLEMMAGEPAFAAADVRLAPASPGKARRLQPFLGHPNATFYVNKGEAESILETRFETSRDASKALVATGLRQALVTDGGNSASLSLQSRTITKTPPKVSVRRYTGAGDVFMAAHICAERLGKQGQSALVHALTACADYISTEEAL